MTPKIKNIIIFVTIGAVFILIYIFFIRKPSGDTAPLISSSSTTGVESSAAGDINSSITKDFLTLLLSVKNIKLDDSIFSDPAFLSLYDPDVTLTAEGNEGRVNPFAPLGADIVAPPANTVSPAGPLITP